MKRIILILIFVTLPIKFFCQTKIQTFNYLNEKLEMYKLETLETNYIYMFQEVEIKSEKVINFLEFCTTFELCSTAYFISPTNYYGIATKNKTNAIWIELYFKPNSITTQQIDLDTKYRFMGDNVSRLTIILEKNTPKNEIDKIKKAFLHLLKLYGVEKKDLFD